MATYVPRVVICEDVEAFRKIIGDKPVEIVGQVNFDDAKNFDDAAEYLIFTDPLEHREYVDNSPYNPQVMSAVAFAKKIHDGFFSIRTIALLYELLNQKKFGRVLDFDGYLAKSDFNTRGDVTAVIDCIGENLFPIMENVYDKIYQTFDECKFHIFNTIIFSRERSPEEFIDALIQTSDLADRILLFVRKNSALEAWLEVNQNLFAQVESFAIGGGAWCLLKKVVPPADVGVYVVTHKDVKLSKLPPCYKIIHAGHAMAKNEFGYLGDDTGENISRLNPFLDEVTALYWIWKNTNHTHTGFVNYRRFLTRYTRLKEYRPGEYVFSVKNILSESEIL
ncbi:MAG: DUF4422 domain-containing protein, partial [Selenomonadaceae bacterium]|nr:DUF4422 domain-containing protein [Selenomonadaceae bacterium]